MPTKLQTLDDVRRSVKVVHSLTGASVLVGGRVVESGLTRTRAEQLRLLVVLLVSRRS